MNKNILIAFLILATFFIGCSDEKQEKNEKEKIKVVKILDLKDSKNIIKSFEYPAQIEAFQDTNMAFEVPGKIIKFYYKEGEKVRKGSVIAKLDDEIYKANYNSAKANYTQAEIDYNRYKKLYEQNFIAKVDYEKQKQNLDVTKAALQVAKKNLDETKLIAEFDGVMAKKLVDDFARVKVKQAIVRLQDNSSYKIKFFVPESDILKFKGNISPDYISSLITFYVSLGEKRYEAKLIDISTTAEEVTRTFEATLQMPHQKNATILPGMTAQVEALIKKSKQNRIFIPYKSVFTDESKNSFIWQVNKDNRVQKQKINVGEVSGDSVEVLSGLENVSKIVISGVRFLESNDEVKEYEKLDK
ncbi:efflux RND transporter periplasmic adaptor subunit [Campylobacterota bacterium DY0563]